MNIKQEQNCKKEEVIDAVESLKGSDKRSVEEIIGELNENVLSGMEDRSLMGGEQGWSGWRETEESKCRWCNQLS